MNEQAQWWAGQAGVEYHERNRVDWWRRCGRWADILDITRPRSVYEVGCGPGWNLSAIQAERPQTRVYGCDVNVHAVGQARAAGLDVYQGDALDALGQFGECPTFDLVFTCGFLIHVPPSQLKRVMDAIVAVSARWVVAIEYAADELEAVEYRGTNDRLWRGPYGLMYADAGLVLTAADQLGRNDGFDDCTVCILEKRA